MDTGSEETRLGERLRILLNAVGSLFRWIGRALAWLVSGLWDSLARVVRLFGVGCEVRRLERRRRQELEALGRMVYVLHKRSLVRNVDLLAQCEKVRQTDVEIDTLTDAADRIRTAHGAGPSADEAVGPLAATPVSIDPPTVGSATASAGPSPS